MRILTAQSRSSNNINKAKKEIAVLRSATDPSQKHKMKKIMVGKDRISFRVDISFRRKVENAPKFVFLGAFKNKIKKDNLLTD